MTPYYDAGFCLIRTPLLSFSNTMLLFSELEKNPQQASQAIHRFLSDNVVLEGLYIASPDLYYQVVKYLNGEIVKEKARKKIERSLYEYLVRMSTRSTPYGLFAGCATGTFGNATNIVLGPGATHERHVKFDMDYICGLVQLLLKDSGIRKKLYYYPNTSLYKIGKTYRYTEYRFTGRGRSHELVEIENTAVLAKIIEKAADTVSYGSLVGEIVNMGYEEEDAGDFINELIESQVLMSEIDPNVTGEEYVDRLLRIFKLRHIEHEIINAIRYGQEKIESIETFTDKIPVYHSIIERFKTITPNLNEGKIFQLDLIKKTVHNEVNANVKQSVLEAVNVLKKLNNYNVQKTRYELFKKAFFDKYEYATVKLTEALDAELGIDYNNLQNTNANQTSNNNKLDPIMKFKLAKFHEWLRKNNSFIEINDEELAQFKGPKQPIANSFGALIRLVKENEEEKIQIKSIYGSSATSLLGRFCTSNKELEKSLLKLIEEEEKLQPEKIFAEIVHLPQSRIGNILQRSHLRQNEIPYLCNSTLEKDQKISIDDLYLKRQGDRLVVFSKKLNKEIVTKLASAHNYAASTLPVYTFLCETQLQDIFYTYFWDWGFLSREQFLPRVVYKNTILQPATWNVYKNDFSKVSSKQDDNLMKQFFDEFRNEWAIPKYVKLIESDHELMLNLEAPFCIRYLLGELEKHDRIRIQEVISMTDSLVSDTLNEPFFNELAIPFLKIESSQKSVAEKDLTILLNTDTNRRFFLGSEWLYFKLFIHPQSIDKVITKGIYGLMKKLVKGKLIDKWFFLRYSDPKPHIRLRLKMTDKNHTGNIIQELHAALALYLKTGVISNLCTDTYYREMERYGKDTIEISESIFYWNSIIACELINLLPKVSKPFRQLAGLYFTDQLLTLFNYDVDKRIAFFNEGFHAYAAEHNLDNNKSLKEKLKEDYRENAGRIKEMLHNSGSPIIPDRNKIAGIIDKISNKHKKDLYKLNDILQKTKSPELNKMLRSQIHLFFIRLFEENQRTEELIMYNRLYKYYFSKKVRGMQ